MVGGMDQPADHTQHYDLFSTDGGAGFTWRNHDGGVGLDAESVIIMRAGRWTSIAFADIDMVTLSSTVIGQSRPIGQCILTLADGRRIIITNANSAGIADGARDAGFRQFVLDFHAALIASHDAQHIDFRSGFTQRRMNGLVIALIAAAVLFVGVPLFLLLKTNDPESLWLLIAGVFLILPAWRIARTNQPAEYQAGAPPDLLR